MCCVHSLTLFVAPFFGLLTQRRLGAEVLSLGKMETTAQVWKQTARESESEKTKTWGYVLDVTRFHGLQRTLLPALRAPCATSG